ncbi:MAG: winged helix-turn-helix domain-containing protein [Actinomycetota bacterium]|nr:winged helix-turn-helix domain-containing protein [Actinomycetota bacterium]
MEFSILGPLEAVAEGGAVSLGAAKPRALLAILLLHVNEPVSSDRLIEDLWANQPPATAAKVLQAYISQLRRALGRDTIATRPAGYELCVETGGLDVHRFERLVTEARGAAPPDAARQLRQALALWRGSPLLDFAFEPWAQTEIARLEELRLDALQARIDADLALGRHAELVGELELLVAEHPLLERPRGQLMLALYRSGRQAEALDAYRTARRTLVATLGIEPGSALRGLERAILHQDPELDPLPAAPERGEVLSLQPTTSFVGRRRELQEIPTLLRRADVRLLTLTGAGGTGKTRLALETTAGIADDFPDGVVLIELAPVSDPRLVATVIVGALGLSESAVQEPAEVLVAYLRARRVLLVLDNFEQVLAAAPLLAEVLADAPGVRLLVTSRAPLDLSEERVYPVPALQVPASRRPGQVGHLRRTEAVRLFIDRARDARADFELSDSNADDVVELCIRLDGLPLALELAAARIKLLSPGAILTRLDRKLEPLKAAPGAQVPDRHRTLRAAIEWSYDLLDPNEQALLTSVSVFVGGFTLDGAEAVVGEFELDVVDGVESLLNNNLLRTERMAGGEPRFGMLETIREYALERLTERGDGEVVRRRHAGFYALLAEKAEPELRGPQQLTWVERLDAELANIRAALTWATESGEVESGQRIGAGLWRFWQMRGLLDEGRERLERLLAVGSGSRAARASVEWTVATIAIVQGDHDAVRRFLEASLPVHRKLGDDRRVASSLAVLCASAVATGDADKALALAEEGLAVARRSGDPSMEAMLLFNVGMAHGWRRELEEAESAIEESVRKARQGGNVTSVANWLRALGSISVARCDWEQARAHFEESLDLGRELGQPWCISHSLSNLALVAQETRDYDTARRLLAESIAIEQEGGERLGLAANLEVYGRLAAAQDHPVRAAHLYGCASVLRESVGVDACELGWPDPEPHVARLRDALGAEAFAEAWEEGRSLTLDESLDYALAEEADADRVPSRHLHIHRT